MKQWNSTLNVGKSRLHSYSTLQRGNYRLKTTKPLQRGHSELRRTSGLRMRGVNESSVIKDRIQDLLREIGILRDGGCVLRDFWEAGACGPHKVSNGKLVLQFDHLNSRGFSVSYSDERLGVCVCLHHHFFFKKRYPKKYETMIEKAIGPERYSLLERVRNDRTPHHMGAGDWKLEEMRLKQVRDQLLALKESA